MKEAKPWLCGPLTPGKAGKHHPMREVTFSPAEITRVCNGSSFLPYIPQDRTVYRPGSIDASRPKVRGCA